MTYHSGSMLRGTDRDHQPAATRVHTERRKVRGRPAAVLWNVAKYVLVTGWVLLSLFPFYFTVTTSLKIKRDVLEPTSWIFNPTLSNYDALFTQRNFIHYLINSTIVTIGSVVPSLILALLAAYGLTRFNMKRERTIASTLLSFRMIPAIAVVIPFFLIAQITHLLDTQFLLALAYTTMNVPLAVWMLRGFMRGIPMELDEAAQLDGAGPIKILWRLHVPIMAPGIASTAILLIIQSWNEFVFAQFLTSTEARTFPTTIGFFLSIAGTDFGQMAAAAVIGTLPLLVFAFIMRRRLVSGLAYGAV